MGVEANLFSLPLSCLPIASRDLLSYMLDTPKIILNEPDMLPRDWRGLAHLVNISSQNTKYIELQPQKTIEVLKIWQKDPTATIGLLLNYLERLDRFDVYDDLIEELRISLSNGELVVNNQNQIAIKNNNNNNSDRNNYSPEGSNVITYDDLPGYEQHYDAFVLYAEKDKTFVEDLIRRMTDAGFKLCTVDRLLVGYSTQYAPVAKLISERCQRIILVLSPDFFSSVANTFYSDYAQAVSIESNRHKILPIVYRACQLPSHLTYYHKLYYNEGADRGMYDFWLKLKQSLALVRTIPVANRTNGITTPVPRMIVELPSSSIISDYVKDNSLFLPSPPRSVSMHDLDSLNLKADSNSLSSVSQKSNYSDEKKKKPNKIMRLINTLKPKKSKSPIKVAH